MACLLNRLVRDTGHTGRQWRQLPASTPTASYAIRAYRGKKPSALFEHRGHLHGVPRIVTPLSCTDSLCPVVPEPIPYQHEQE